MVPKFEFGFRSAKTCGRAVFAVSSKSLFFAHLGEESKAEIALMVLLDLPSAAVRFASSICASSKDVLA